MISDDDVNSISGVESKGKVNWTRPGDCYFSVVVEHEVFGGSAVDSNEENSRIGEISVAPKVGLEDEPVEAAEGGSEEVAVVDAERVGDAVGEINLARSGNVRLEKKNVCFHFRHFIDFSF